MWFVCETPSNVYSLAQRYRTTKQGFTVSEPCLSTSGMLSPYIPQDLCWQLAPGSDSMAEAQCRCFLLQTKDAFITECSPYCMCTLVVCLSELLVCAYSRADLPTAFPTLRGENRKNSAAQQGPAFCYYGHDSIITEPHFSQHTVRGKKCHPLCFSNGASS